MHLDAETRAGLKRGPGWGRTAGTDALRVRSGSRRSFVVADGVERRRGARHSGIDPIRLKRLAYSVVKLKIKAKTAMERQTTGSVHLAFGIDGDPTARRSESERNAEGMENGVVFGIKTDQ